MDKKGQEKFWSKVKKTKSCWFWLGAPTADGYGLFQYKGERKGAHRWSWIFHNGEIPKGLSVLHKCDNPPCVNPKHLKIGTQLENVQDIYNRGRRKRSRVFISGQLHERERIKKIIVEELVICHTEGQQTSRLTSLYNKVAGSLQK